MSKKIWDRQDRLAWDSSVVMKELEKIASIADKANQAKTSLESANVSAKNLLKTMGETSFAKDGSEFDLKILLKDLKKIVKSLEDHLDGRKEEKEEEVGEEASDHSAITEQQHALAKQRLIEELTKVSHEAADEGNIKLAYELERAIQDLLGE
jgi:hypothetical protein